MKPHRSAIVNENQPLNEEPNGRLGAKTFDVAPSPSTVPGVRRMSHGQPEDVGDAPGFHPAGVAAR
jgi:hypothetical protein